LELQVLRLAFHKCTQTPFLAFATYKSKAGKVKAGKVKAGYNTFRIGSYALLSFSFF
jgi:hypothetical protein